MKIQPNILAVALASALGSLLVSPAHATLMTWAAHGAGKCDRQFAMPGVIQACDTTAFKGRAGGLKHRKDASPASSDSTPHSMILPNGTRALQGGRLKRNANSGDAANAPSGNTGKLFGKGRRNNAGSTGTGTGNLKLNKPVNTTDNSTNGAGLLSKLKRNHHPNPKGGGDSKGNNGSTSNGNGVTGGNNGGTIPIGSNVNNGPGWSGNLDSALTNLLHPGPGFDDSPKPPQNPDAGPSDPGSPGTDLGFSTPGTADGPDDQYQSPPSGHDDAPILTSDPIIFGSPGGGSGDAGNPSGKSAEQETSGGDDGGHSDNSQSSGGESGSHPENGNGDNGHSGDGNSENGHGDTGHNNDSHADNGQAGDGQGNQGGDGINSPANLDIPTDPTGGNSSSVPEPGVLSLLGIALLGFGMSRRKRR